MRESYTSFKGINLTVLGNIKIKNKIYTRVPPWVVCAFSPGIPQLQSDWSLCCDHGLDYAS